MTHSFNLNTQEAQISTRSRPAWCTKFQDNQNYTVRPYLKIRKERKKKGRREERKERKIFIVYTIINLKIGNNRENVNYLSSFPSAALFPCIQAFQISRKFFTNDF